MKIALTGGRSLLGGVLAQALASEGGHEVTLVPEGDLRDEAFAQRAVRGAETLIHLAPLYPDAVASEQDEIDQATRGTYVLLNAALEAGVKRIILGSTLDLFERYPAAWNVGETWQPLPDVRKTRELAVYLAEETVKQFARVEPLLTFCLRFGEVVDELAIKGKSFDSRWLHVQDAVQAVRAALVATPGQRPPRVDGGEPQSPRSGWWVFHIPGGGPARVPIANARAALENGGLGYAPQHDLSGGKAGAFDDGAPDLAILGPQEHLHSRPIRKVVVFGAGGPLAAATSNALAGAYTLRLTDVRAIAEIAAEGKPQSPGAPLPAPLDAPHEMRVVDVTQYDQVRRACEGMDAIVNCTVVRPHPVNAFLVNLIGAYNVMRAATEAGIRKVVHTGPLQVSNDRPAGYFWDFDVPDDAPGRPGIWLYGITKYLGQEVVRLFAEQYDLLVPSLFYSIFANPETHAPRPGGVHPMTISWEDAGLAMRRALEVAELPRPFEIFHILADLPHGKYSNAKAKRLLGWQPRDSLAHLWAHRHPRD
ncbi:MAG TPA: NAD(P)-dependent oxidoreductase [Chloroflexota bacterium]|nr:NAD(P)-dependent oxidoreductase [Chloroflexota bacterium]